VEPTYSIKDLIEKHGFSTAELANRLNTEPDEVQAWVAGKVTPSGDDLTKLANVFDIRPDQITTGASARS
jgi:transcriptional regulator with XRE-family HTH domain